MLNGITGASAVCCSYSPDSGNSGYGVNAATKPVNIGGVRVNMPRSGGGLLQQIGEALNQAVHGGDSLQAQRLIDSAARTYSGGANVVPFPMVNPYKPVMQARIPVSGLTRFPQRFTYEVENADSEPDDEQSSLDGVDSGLSGLGLYDAELGPPPPIPIYRPASNSSGTLQNILSAIQGTLPATIQAFRAQPSNIYPNTYNPYQTSGSAYPGEGTGRAAENVGAGVGRAADTLGGTVSRFVAEHPYMVIAGGAALALLFMNPPRRR